MQLMKTMTISSGTRILRHFKTISCLGQFYSDNKEHPGFNNRQNNNSNSYNRQNNSRPYNKENNFRSYDKETNTRSMDKKEYFTRMPTTTYSKPFYRENQRLQELQKKNSPRIVDASYWEQLLPRIEEKACKVVRIILNKQSSKKEIMLQLQQYMSFGNVTFSKDRSDLGCLAILVAINQPHNGGNLQEYENRIVDFITLADITYNQFDSTMLRYLLMAIHMRIGMNLQKNIRQYYRLKLVEIAFQNFQRMDNKDLIQLISIVQDSIEKDRMNFITKWRFYPIMQAIQGRVMTLMKTYIQANQCNIQQSVEAIITPTFMYKYLHSIFFYDCLTAEEATILYNFMVKKDLLKKDDFHHVWTFINSLAYTPYVQIPLEKNKPGFITIRRKLLDLFEKNYNNSSFVRKAWADFHIQAKKYTLQRFLQDGFHSTFRSLPFESVDGKYLILKQKDLIRPVIPQFVWRLFKESQKLILQKFILNDTVVNLYPQKVSLHKSQIPKTYSKHFNAGSVDNEANLKIWEALDLLGYEYKKEPVLSQRQVDLLIGQNIIVEVDGQSHYMHLINDLAPTTSYRNLHLLLSGYKLVIISMYQYNNNRSTEQLKNLLKEKIELVQKQGVVYVG